jgi:hypothetical protein
MDIKILIATHKQFDVPRYSSYLPIHAGREGKAELGYTGDNTGENISIKNPYYCELTALYWAWNNLKADYIGLVQYRRFLSYKHKGTVKDNVLAGEYLYSLCKTHDIILPKKRYYIIETNWQHYAHTHGCEYLDKTRIIIRQNYPEYLVSFDKVMKKRSAHMFNMFVMKEELVDKYCKWLFDILLQLEKQIDFSDLPPFQARMPARIGELLLDVWITKNHYTYKEVSYVQAGPVKWHKKIRNFLMAKFAGRIYTESC